MGEGIPHTQNPDRLHFIEVSESELPVREGDTMYVSKIDRTTGDQEIGYQGTLNENIRVGSRLKLLVTNGKQTQEWKTSNVTNILRDGTGDYCVQTGNSIYRVGKLIESDTPAMILKPEIIDAAHETRLDIQKRLEQR